MIDLTAREKTLPFFRGAKGLNNLADPTKILIDQNGYTELSIAYNVDIDDYGRLSRIKGFTLTPRTESIHSVWSSKDQLNCFFVSGSSLFRLNLDFTRIGIRSGLAVGARMSFIEVDGVFYYSNGFEKGYIIDNISYSWIAKPYTGPTTTKVFSDPPVGTHLELFNGRIYIAVGKQLYYSEPFAFSWFNLASSYSQFESRIIFIKSVLDGLYVGTEGGVFFLSGSDPNEFSVVKISISIPVEYTDIKINEPLLPDDFNATNEVIFWTASDGIWIGMKGGNAINLTKNKLVIPLSKFGCASVFNGKYLTLLQE